MEEIKERTVGDEARRRLRGVATESSRLWHCHETDGLGRKREERRIANNLVALVGPLSTLINFLLFLYPLSSDLSL
jgi:hypothetical protein